MRHLLSIADLTREDIERILDRAAAFEQIADREVKKVPALRGRTVLNLFYEASTRTRSMAARSRPSTPSRCFMRPLPQAPRPALAPKRRR